MGFQGEVEEVKLEIYIDNGPSKPKVIWESYYYRAVLTDSTEIQIESVHYDAMGRRYWTALTSGTSIIEDILKDLLLDIIKTGKLLKVKK